jgi:hypothetical protein
LLAFLLIAWKWELVGGILYTAIGIGLSPVLYLQNYNRNHNIWLSLSIILMITVPFMVVGILFIIGYYHNKNVQKPG